MTRALLVIDPQADFLALTAPGTVDTALAAMERLVATARESGTPVVFTQELHRPGRVDFGRELDGDEPVHCIEETPGAAFVPGLRPRPGELVVVKRRYSAFFATDLQLLLAGLGVDELVACGLLTDVCVHYTCVDAHQHGLHVRAVPEACAGSSRAAHDAALAAVAYLQTEALVALDDACAVLAGSVGASARPSRAAH